jgi:uncharacterized protein YkwD
MKKLYILLFFIPHVLFSQDSLNIYFEKILNQYRISNNLQPLKFDIELKKFADNHASYMAEMQLVTHGEGDYTLDNRWKKYSEKYKSYYAGENCTELLVPQKNTLKNIKSSVEELNPLLNKLLKNDPTTEDLALYAFIMWKNSKSHNELLLDSKMKYFYFSVKKNRNYYYCEFVCYDGVKL